MNLNAYQDPSKLHHSGVFYHDDGHENCKEQRRAQSSLKALFNDMLDVAPTNFHHAFYLDSLEK